LHLIKKINYALKARGKMSPLKLKSMLLLYIALTKSVLVAEDLNRNSHPSTQTQEQKHKIDGVNDDNNKIPWYKLQWIKIFGPQIYFIDTIAKSNLNDMQQLISLVNINEGTSDNGNTPLHYAAAFSNSQIIQFLIDNGADINATNNSGFTPLHVALLRVIEDNNNTLPLIQLLIDEGAHVNTQAESGMTPLDCALVLNKLPAMQLLIDNGADINVTALSGVTPLHQAIKFNNLKAVTCLIKNGANIDAKDNDGRTPLHWAAVGSNTIDDSETAELLINNGAHINIRDNEGKTPLDRALKNDHFKLARLLIKKNSDSSLLYEDSISS
jgi:ankyrin repeat protein